MNFIEANEMAAAFKTAGNFSRIAIVHRGEGGRIWGGDNSVIDNDGKWRVELWFVNPKAGTTTLEVAETYTADAAGIALIAKKAQGKATKADAKALARIFADRERAVRGE